MGSMQSGRWDYTHRRKPLRELSVLIDISIVTLDPNFRVDASGEIIWSDSSIGSIGYRVLGRDQPTAIQFGYTVGPAVTKLHVPIAKQQLPRGGYRWWGFCPKCDRRISKLYRPKHGSEFACRHCHRLTYLACQQHDARLKKFATAFRYADPATMFFAQLVLSFKLATQVSFTCEERLRRGREADVRYHARLRRRRERRRLKQSASS